MKWFRMRLSALLWVVAVVAAFLGGMRYGEYRAKGTRRYTVFRMMPTTKPGEVKAAVVEVPPPPLEPHARP